ncbi:MAG TPA: AarF/ABC1/UbiB kinase family protein [Anaerolineae bacterium]|nr:AarF/ABC1/UbiB kinase family protein [Anaerolineae bacterium]
MSFFFGWRRRMAEVMRVRHIIEVLVRNGLGFMVELLALDRFLPRFWRRRLIHADAVAARRAVPERVRRTLEELGAAYIKLGQFLSGRADLLPPEYIAELTKLLDAAPPVSFDEVREVIEEELGASIEILFDSIEEVPIASASIGQVHRAVLPGGDTVIVKVQRPGIGDEVDADLDLLVRQARFLERHSEAMRDQNVAGIAEGLAQSVRAELDYRREGRNAERMRANVADDPRFIVPCVFWNLTTQRVITMEYLAGIQFNQIGRLHEAGYNLASVAEVAIEGYLEQIFVDGFFHADPHPANLLVVGKQVGLLDFGNMGHLTEGQKRQLGDLFIAILDEDAEGVARTVIKMGASRGRPSLEAMERDVERLLMRYWGLPLEELPVGEAIAEIFKAAYQHRVYLPGDLALLARTIITLEGTGRMLDPEIMIVDALRPFAARLVQERLSPVMAGRRALRAVRQAADFAQVFPRRLDDLWDQLEAGDLTFGVEVRRLSLIIGKLNGMVNRITYSIIVAALIIGSSLILHGGRDAWQLPILGVRIPVVQIAFLAAIAFGFWYVITVIRSRTL